MSNKLIFRADGNSSTGLGHLYRLFALVEMYKEKHQFIFITRESSVTNVIPNDYPVKIIPNSISLNEEPKWIFENYNSSEYSLIADGYQFDESYQKRIRQLGFFLMYIDDLVTGYMHANIVINHSLNIDKKEYSSNPETVFGLGSEYAILRPSFLKAAQQTRIIKLVSKIFICFGGADAIDLSHKAALAAIKTNKFEKIHILIGQAYKHEKIFELEKEYVHIKIHKNLTETETFTLMLQCNFAIAPASTILYELCAIKTIVLSGYFVDNQKNIYRSLLNENAIYGAGNISNFTEKDFEKEINKVLNFNSHFNLLENQQKLFDNQIKKRFLQILEFKNISIRRATNKDTKLVFDWSNDPLTRKNSFNSEAIIYENHIKWFSKKIIDKNTLVHIAEYLSLPVGVIKYKNSEGNLLIGITISKEFRGKKLAYFLLLKSIQNCFSEFNSPITAYIKKENIPSIKIFEKIGFVLQNETKINDIESLIYKLEKL
jgi:UDP-2,4-diacetamido-2,4,6-trideoxy-beta-L-altropyranose hydrolase